MVSVFSDVVIYICALVFIFLIWCYGKTKDKDLIYFILSDISYLLGEICYDTISYSTDIPFDFIFFFLFYFFIILFFKQRTKVLLKNPTKTEKTEIKTIVLIILDYFIIAILSYLIFYYFDRISLSKQPVISAFNLSMVLEFIYPVLDFLMLGYYILINKIYIVNDRKVYFPLIAGISIWTVGDFLIAYEGIFKEATYNIGDYLQVAGLIILICILVLIKINKTDSNYTTINLYRDNSKLGNYNSLMNGLIFLYIAIYIYCLICANSLSLMKTVRDLGIVLLILAILRQNIINIDIQYKLSRMSKDASSDPLTGLFSRKYAFNLLKSLYKSSLYFKSSISVLMIDIDNFKKFNDSFGHVRGDNVLKDIALILNSSIDASNIICRYGGEEFLIILPGINQTEGLLIAERIRQSIENCDYFDQSNKITVSIGGATADSETKDENDLVEKADIALYKAKENRNESSWYMGD